MEQFLPLIIALIAGVYKLYSNYRKEQEKARQRQGSLGRQMRDRSREAKETRLPVPQVPEAVAQEREQVRREPLQRESLSRNPEVPAEEVLKNRRIHKSHNHGNLPKAQKEEPPVQFDMRDAIVKEAILRRPEY
jgi:hypothetical protein